MPAAGAGREDSRRGQPSGWSRRETLALVALVAGAAAWRWLAWTRTAVLFDDGPRFLAIARAIDAGWWSAALRDSFHPLYPASTAWAHRLLRAPETAAGWETAAALVSVLGGAAAVAFLYLFLRDAFGRAVASGGALLLAVHGRAVEYASDVQSDGLYLGLYAAGLWAGWRAWRGGSPAWAALAGVASGLAYLTRPEGLGLALVLAALGVGSIVRRRWTRRAGAAWLVALGTATAACMAPYVVALHALTGEWTLTHKKSVAALVGAERGVTPGAPVRPRRAPPPESVEPAPAPPEATATAGPATRTPARSEAQAPVDPPAPAPDRAETQALRPPWLDALGLGTPLTVRREDMAPAYLEQDGLRVALAPSAPRRAFEALRMLVRHAKSSLGYGVLALACAGLVACRGRPGARGVYVLASLLLYAGVLYALTASSGYVSRRHALPPLLPLFGYAGAGALAAGAWLARAARAPKRGVLAGALVLAVFAAGEGAEGRAPKRVDALAGRRAAEWLRDHAPQRGPLAASRQRLGYYAEMPYVPLTGIADGALGRYLSRVGARYVLIEEPGRLEALRRAEGDAVRVLHRVEVAGEQAWVLERQAPAEAGSARR
ncbi:MAG: glycosyltransferase family 39 protein [Deltaproteobacteria bacterium]|nr:glycosyltransferase family 39 protein [Deltaproteobacteria bacterium]